MADTWDELYGEKFGAMWCPDEGLVRFVARFLRRRIGVDSYDERRSAARILDAGCGHGRHIIFLAEQHLEVYGVELSTQALRVATEWLAKRTLEAQLSAGDITRLPFQEGTFDVIISYGVLDHMRPQQARQAVEEIRRVLVEGGYFYVTLRSTGDCEYGRGQKVATNTFILKEGYEKGLVQHFYSWEDVANLLGRFRIFDIECHDERFPSSFGIDKAFLQSSRGLKGPIDDSAPNLDLKYSRWHVAAERRQAGA
jgi:SAM-dependent methyltransferase